MSEDDSHLARGAVGHIEPWHQTLIAVVGCRLDRQDHAPFERAHPHARQRVDDHAEPFATAVAVLPVIWFITVHFLQHFLPVVAA